MPSLSHPHAPWVLETSFPDFLCVPGAGRVPVADVISAGVVGPDNDEDVLKVGADVLGGERQRPGLLEDDGHDVVAYVPLPQQLVVGRWWWGRGKHQGRLRFMTCPVTSLLAPAMLPLCPSHTSLLLLLEWIRNLSFPEPPVDHPAAWNFFPQIPTWLVPACPPSGLG